ncbi:MAG: hypothetical protein ABIX12_02140, partial [Rubrivivax sp.]
MDRLYTAIALGLRRARGAVGVTLDGRHPRDAATSAAVALFILIAALGAGLPARAALLFPTSDDEVVERLPWAWDAVTRSRQAALARDPKDLPLALTAARDAIDRSRRHGDPRELGVAQAALGPWWAMPNPPAAVRLLRATVRQGLHDFDGALTDLDVLWADPTTPLALRAQAGLTRVTVLQVIGRLADAARACDGLS